MKKGLLISLITYALAASSTLHAFQLPPLKGAFVFAEAVRWQVREGGADMVGELISPVGTQNPSVELLDAPFEWNTGYRIGGGYQNTDHWDVLAYYTSYNTEANRELAAPGQLYSPYIGNFFENNTLGKNNGPFYDAAQFSWDIHYYTIDVELGRTIQPDNLIILRPFLGLKGAVINQAIDTQWQGPNTLVSNVPVPITTFSSATEELSNRFWGIGPSFGLNTTWPVHAFSQSTLSLVGNFSTALMWGSWRYKDDYQTNGGSSVKVTGDPINGAAPMVKAVVGLEWHGTFRKADVNASINYEEQAWFDQMQMNTLSSGRLNDLMSLQGGTLDLRVNF